MSHSNMNKSVITVPRGHFKNSVVVDHGIYSCAVDTFLETSTHCFFHIYQVYVIGMILKTCLREKTVHY